MAANTSSISAIVLAHWMEHISESLFRQLRHRPIVINRAVSLKNVLGVCGFNIEFQYVLSGWEGTAHDQRVVINAREAGGFVIPAGAFYLGDAGYTSCDWILTPYLKTRYYLKESRLAAVKPATKKNSLTSDTLHYATLSSEHSGLLNSGLTALISLNGLNSRWIYRLNWSMPVQHYRISYAKRAQRTI